MEVKDLMIGDWVCTKKWRENPYRLTRINSYGKYYYGVTANDSQVGPFFIEEIEPIPLTTEILKKYGFVEKSERRWVLSDEYTGDEVLVLLEVAIGFAMTTEGMTIGFQNVHELQHLFRLCGITKEIEL